MNKHFEPQQHKFYIVWIPLEGDFAKSMDYTGPWGSLPFLVTPDLDGDSHKQGNLNLWQLQQGMIYCWDKEPNGARNIPKDARRQILRNLGEKHNAQDLMATVGAVNGHMLDMIGFDAGINCAANGLEICEANIEYARLFTNTTIAYVPMLGDKVAAIALKALLKAGRQITVENARRTDVELSIAAQTAALAVLGDKQGLSDFCAHKLKGFNFTNQELAEFIADLSVNIGAPRSETFMRLRDLMHALL